MYASIVSWQMPDFYCRVFSEPVIFGDGGKVYKLAGHGAGVMKFVNGEYAGEFHHLAIDRLGCVHLFDEEKLVNAGKIGPCELIVD